MEAVYRLVDHHWVGVIVALIVTLAVVIWVAAYVVGVLIEMERAVERDDVARASL